jgi:hypothetical protein
MQRNQGRKRRRELALYQMEWGANRADKITTDDRIKLERGAWAAFRGEAWSAKRNGYTKETWYGQVLRVEKGAYKVRYALKRPTSLVRVGTTCYMAPASAVLERVDNIAGRLQWRFEDPLEMLVAAAECVVA